jgi:hypothetical protein
MVALVASIGGKPRQEPDCRPLFIVRPNSADGGSMTEIAVTGNEVSEWLDGYGLPQYKPAFVQNAITWELVPELTDQDLRELGVSALGHRKQLLRAIKVCVASVVRSRY